MSFVQIISANEYIGDSLVKINNNFNNIDDALLSLSAGNTNTSGSLSSIFVTDKEYTRISTDVIIVKNTIEQYLTPALCDVRLSCSSSESYTYSNIESDVLYLHSYNGNYISFYNTYDHVWYDYELTEVRKFYLRVDSLNDKTSRLRANGLYSVFLYLENNILKVLYVQALYSNTVDNIISRDITYIDGVPVYAQDYSKRFIGVVKLNSRSNCVISQENINLYNYNNFETNIFSNSSINFIVFENTKITFNTVLPKNTNATISVNNKDKKTTVLYNVNEQSYFENFVINLVPSRYSLELSAATFTPDMLISTTIKA